MADTKVETVYYLDVSPHPGPHRTRHALRVCRSGKTRAEATLKLARALKEVGLPEQDFLIALGQAYVVQDIPVAKAPDDSRFEIAVYLDGREISRKRLNALLEE